MERDARGRPVTDDTFLLLFNSYGEPIDFRLPPAAFGEEWQLVLDTADPSADADSAPIKAEAEFPMEAHSLRVLRRDRRE
ncbi:hypothetical protein ACFYNY_20115 [Streptomyces sp. NPDC006530]|uniref:hypothetical protein n=1 Tax=Streptomyces sp. NPDC006530 TaxID=3364750 RepID=UPI0036C68DA6